jgi:putative ABC transport system permease protein
VGLRFTHYVLPGEIMDTLWQDLRYGARMLVKNPGFTLIAVLTLALGIGANTAIFSIVNAVLLRPLPYPDAGRLISLSGIGLNTGNFVDWKQRVRSYEPFVAISLGIADLTGVDEPMRLRVMFISEGFFELLGVQPAQGRAFLPQELQPGGTPTMIVSHGLSERLGLAQAAIGRTLTLDQKPYTVVGVMPAGFGPLPYQRIDAWVPLLPSRPQGAEALGRLRSGTTLEGAAAEAQAIAHGLPGPERVRPSESLIHVERLKDRIVGDSRLTLLVLAGAVGFVLLIACVNVANLMLARMTGRDREMAVRTALGASRPRLMRQLLTESFLLSGVSAALALLVALWSTSFLLRLMPYRIPRIEQSGIDALVFVFAALLAGLTAVLCGLAPALQASRVNVHRALKEGAGGVAGSVGRRQMRSALVISEVALTLVLLVGAGLLIKTFLVLRPSNPGFDPENKLTMRMDISRSRYPQALQQITLLRQVSERVNAVAGVRAVAAVSDLPFTGMSAVPDIAIDGQVVAGRGRGLFVHYRASTPNFFRVMGMPMISGRDFAETDDERAPAVAIINQTMARRFWPNEGPVGRRLTINWPGQPLEVTVVGVVRDARIFGSTTSPRPEVYVPFWQAPQPRIALVVHTISDPSIQVAAVREAVRSAEANLLLTEVQPMDQLLSDSVAHLRFHATLVGILAGLAVVLAVIGIYGVISYSVSQRTREIGIRLTLGARPGDVFWLLLRQVLRLTMVGIVLGLAGALLLTRYLKDLLFEVPTTDSATFTLVTLLWLGVAVAACCIPARRATRVDPMVALRYE